VAFGKKSGHEDRPLFIGALHLQLKNVASAKAPASPSAHPNSGRAKNRGV